MINSRLVDIPLSIRLHGAHGGDIQRLLPRLSYNIHSGPVNHVGRSCQAEDLLMPEQIRRETVTEGLPVTASEGVQFRNKRRWTAA